MQRIAIVISLLILALAFGALGYQYIQCRDINGVLVRGLFAYECISR